MRRPLRIALRVVTPVLAGAVLALAIGRFAIMSEDEVALKHARAGRTAVAADEDEGVRERGQGRVLAMEPSSEPLAIPAQQPTDGGAQAREPLLNWGVGQYVAGLLGWQNQQQSDEQRVAPATSPLAGGGAAPIGATVSPSSLAPQAVSGSGTAGAPAAVLEFLAISRGGKTMPGELFAVDKMRDLKILVWWNVAGQHVQRLELLSPDGSLYQRFVTAFDADAAKLAQPANQPYIPIETMLPVAGTWITDNSLFGAWTVNVYLDEGQLPITSASFSVSPS